MVSPLKIVGQRTARVEGPDKTTGGGRYAVDIAMPDMLWCKVLRSPFPHARVVHLDASRALALPGVHGVLTGQDVEGLRTGNFYQDEPVLASWDRVRFIGDKVAAIVADDQDIAARGLELIDVEYEELPAIFTAEDAIQPGAPLLHSDFNEYRRVVGLDQPSNRYGHLVREAGDVTSGFAAAHVIVERTYRTPRAHQAYLEPHAALVWIDPDDTVQAWVSSQQPGAARNEIARLAGLDPDQVVVNPVYIGGSFGGKSDATGAFLCYLFARMTGRPVKFVMDYTDELGAMDPRHESTITVRAGATRNGVITAWQATAYFPTGAYAAYAPVPPLGGLLVREMAGSYRIPNVRIDSYQVYTNTIPCGYFRGPGVYQGTFAGESHIDAIARELGIDPVELRLRNAITDTAHAHTAASSWNPIAQGPDERPQTIRLIETVNTAVEASRYWDPKPDGVGRGIAIHHESQIGGDTHVAVRIEGDGSIIAHTSSFDPGGGLFTVLAQVVAEELEVPVGRVRVEPWSTADFPPDMGVGGQRGARVTSLAGHQAAGAAKEALKRLAAEFLGWAEEKIVYRQGSLVNPDLGTSVAIETIASRSGQPVVGRGDPREGMDSAYTSFAAHVAEVEVDAETGHVELRKITAVHETGRVLNPVAFEGQIEGGVVQGIGHTLTEDLIVDEGGRVANPSFAEYKLPVSADIPELTVHVLESDEGHGPYNVRGVGDIPISLPAPAIANAVEDAIGARVRHLPITAERVLDALR